MNRLKGLKGLKGLTTIGVLLSVMFVFVISVFYVIPAFAIHSLTLANVTPTNVTSGQKLPSLNFTFTSGGNGNITAVLINFSVVGNNAGNFTVPASNASVICGGKTTSLTGWASSINATAVRCYNTTQDTGARIVFNVSIINTTVGIYAPSARGLYLFNFTTTDNDTETNTTAVGVDVQKITGNGTANVTTAEIGKNQSIKFTIFGGSDSDRSINKIVINFSSAGFVAPVAVSCPGLGNGGNGWGSATIGANDVTCSQGSGSVLGAGASTTIILNGTAAGETPGIQPFYVGLYDTTTGEFANFTNSTTITVFGLLNITGTNLAPSTVFINTNSTNNGTNAARFNFSSRGEQMNVTMITLLRTGTATVADIEEVAIYNGTQNATGGAFVDVSNATLIAKNSSAPDSLGRYMFTNIGFNVSQVTDNFLLVVYNVSRGATGGRTVGFMINNTGNVTVRSSVSNQSITPTLVTTASNNATIVGNITITGTTGIAGAVPAGLRNVSVIRYNFAPSGEQMNVTLITLTRTGTATDADIGDIRLYNSSSDGSNVFTANATLIATNTTPDSLGRYDFNNTGFNVSTSGNQLLVVVDIRSTAVAGRTFGLFINGTGNITTRSSVSNVSITETFVTETSNNATISNFTIVGTNMIPSTVFLNKNGTDNATQAARFNFSAKGEGLNITEINITRTGSATVADILEVAIYNTTDNVTGGFYSIENATLIAKNSSAPRADGTYTFRGIGLNVSAVTDMFVLIAFNVSRSATGGRTVGFMINSIANVSATGAVSGSSMNATFVSGASDNATIIGNITITGTDSLATGNYTVGRTNITVMTFNFAPSGEQMNVTQINLTRTGTATVADILAVGLYNSSSDGSSVFTANATLIAWNSSAPRADGTYNFTGLGFNVSTSGNQLLVVVNLTPGAIGGRTFGFKLNPAANTSITSAVSGQAITPTLVTTSSFNATIVGNLTITGTNTAPGTIFINTNSTNNGTQFVRFNFSTRGEGMNITTITILRTGTATVADILEVALYNATPASASSVDTLTAVQLIGKNTTAPDSLGRYNFSGFQWNISGSADSVDQYLFVVANISRSATGGRTVGFMINNTGNVTTTSVVSNQSITEHLLTVASNNATIVGNLTITGTNATSSIETIGTRNLSIVTFNFAPSGEQMNVTQINLTRTGTATVADILAVGLYNSSSDGSSVFTANATLIAWNSSAPRADGTYNFTGLGFNVSTSGNQLLVIVNLSSSATIGRTIGFTLSPAANVTVTSSVSGQAITATLVTTSAGNATLVGNLTITGTNRISSSVAVGTKNVTAVSLNFSVAGEQMNITAINLSRTGSATDADITAVGLYNGTNTTFNGSSEFLTLIAWNSSAPANGVYNFSGIGFNVTTTLRGNILLVVVNLTNVATTGRTVGFRLDSAANITTSSSITNQSITETLITANSANSSIFGNLTITGTNQVASTVTVGQRNITFISYNFSALGEGMNITAINLTLTGTVSTADIESVALYNGTNTTFNVDFLTEIARNSSAPRADGTYNFTGLGFNITASDASGNVLLVVINFTAGTTTSGGKTIGFTIKAANVSVTSAISNVSITPTLATEASNNATIVGNLTVSTTSDISANVKINQKRVAFLNLSFMARGEVVNVTSINITLRGNASFANVSEIKLLNDDGSATGSLDATDTLINGTLTAPSSARITFTPNDVIRLTPSTATIIFVVLNVSDESDAGAVVGVQVNATDVAATTNVTNQSLSTSWTAVATANRTIQSNIGQQALGDPTGWYTLNIPSQTIMESIGRTSGTTQTFNISKILYSLRTNYRFVYYNTDGTSSGWKLFDRTDWAGSSLQYANNTNDKVYWVNMTAADTFEL